MKNFYPEQYQTTASRKISHNYLVEQFSDYDEIFKKISDVVLRADYTLGTAVDRFEDRFAEEVGAKYAIGVGSGTDALFLSLKALGIGQGDEVIVPTFTFYATIGAIVTAGATPVFIDSKYDFNLDENLIASKITNRTKAIIPVHWSGKVCAMDKIVDIAHRNRLHIIEDACHAIQANYGGTKAGNFGIAGCFSMHPLKNLNVWGDGGIVVTNDSSLSERLRLIRNHGLISRDVCMEFAFNSRLDTIQAVIADHLLDKLDQVSARRIENAEHLDLGLSTITGVSLPDRAHSPDMQVFHIYSVLCEDRDELARFLFERGIDAKVHYPVPMHLQPAAAALGHDVGDFPVAEDLARKTLSLPVHEFISKEQVEYMIDAVADFYR